MASRLRKNPTLDAGADEKFDYDARKTPRGGAHARRWPRISATHVELRAARAAGPGRTSAAAAAGHGRRGPPRAVAGVRSALFQGRTPVDSPRALAAGSVAAGALQRAQRAAAHGAARLQPALPVVCGPGHG